MGQLVGNVVPGADRIPAFVVLRFERAGPAAVLLSRPVKVLFIRLGVFKTRSDRSPDGLGTASDRMAHDIIQREFVTGIEHMVQLEVFRQVRIGNSTA
jgi:hypothetical protein|nr:hypothetical protein [uncultured bacterium]